LLRRFLQRAVAASVLAMISAASSSVTALASPGAGAHGYHQLHTGVGLCVDTSGDYHVGAGLSQQYCVGGSHSPTQWIMDYSHGEVQIELLKDRSLCIAQHGMTIHAVLAYCSPSTWLRYTKLQWSYVLRLRSATNGRWLICAFSPGHEHVGNPISWSSTRKGKNTDWNVPTDAP
jgi:hypothetical protein